MGEDAAAYAQVRDYLYGLKHRGALYGIDRMLRFAEALGHPERAYPVIHVAGTNGKGSTCALLESILRAAGCKTGLFTSPHLVHQGERIQVNRQILSHAAIVRHVAALRPVAEALGRRDEDLHPSFFEFMTGMAFEEFRAQAVDVGIIETGLGGRLDATNVVRPSVCVITSISYDHTDILGQSLEKIAWEKAGIIKPGVPVVIGCLPAAAERVIRRVAAERGCGVTSVREAFGSEIAGYPQVALHGDYQRRNAAAAVLAARLFARTVGMDLPEAAIAVGLQSVRWAGRWETVQLNDRTLILDATHNPEGVVELERNLQQLIAQSGRKPIILVGTLGAARGEVLLPVVAQYARALVLLKPEQPRALDFAQMRALLGPVDSLPVHNGRVREIFPAAGECRIGEPGETLLATGSIYLIGEIMDAVRHDRPVGEGPLQD